MKLALGTAQFGLNYGIANQQGQITLDNAKSILSYAMDNGITTLDTAIGYGDSEKRLGEAGVENWQVVTKLPSATENCQDLESWVKEAVVNSTKRLNVKKLYGLLLHRPFELLGKDGNALFRALQQVKREGMVQKIGISIYDPSELDQLCNRFRFDLVQAPFNIVDRRILTSGWLRQLHDSGIEIHTRSIYLQGLLLMKSSKRPEKFGRWEPLWKMYDTWLKDNDVSPLQACLSFPSSFDEIGKIIVGVDSLQQLKEVVRSTDVSVPPIADELASDDLELIDPARWAELA